MNMQFQDVLVFLIAAGLSWWILSFFGVFNGNKAARKAAADRDAMKSIQRKRRITNWCLGFFENFAMKLGGGISESAAIKYDYIIQRREMYIKILGRQWKPIELVGIFRFLGFVGCIITAIGITRFTINIAWLGFMLCFVDKVWLSMQEMILTDEDKELEHDFPSLYLLLNPKLQMGSNARIATVLSDYMQTLELTYAPTEHLAIKRFVRLLRNHIELYSDEVLALMKVRSLYKAAVVINFCNLAIQAMNGVDNKEKLISFEEELTRQQLDYMRGVQEARIEKANKVLYALYIILGEFVVLSWVSRMGGNFDALFHLI